MCSSEHSPDAGLDARFRNFNMNNTPAMKVLLPSYGAIIKQRARRNYIPINQKDDTYWMRRRKNNEAAKLSRLKRRVFEISMEQRLSQLVEENTRLKDELMSLRAKYGITDPCLDFRDVGSKPELNDDFYPGSSSSSSVPQDSCDSLSYADQIELSVPSSEELWHVQESLEQNGPGGGDKSGCQLPHKLRHKSFTAPFYWTKGRKTEGFIVMLSSFSNSWMNSSLSFVATVLRFFLLKY